ncbi:TnsA-like heteromeric transposase endonuclease subunit [Agromyces sp. NPDC058104]|uniref:TnsA-like heteromeric transposase endonuclease subunit n=1 Tax=Agromyces sp. NPDC058104 TaxID=3346342 RepID=UPI0036DF24AC
MAVKPLSRKLASTGRDELHWSARGVTHSAPVSRVAEMLRDEQLEFARMPRKFKGQSNYHGRYWCAGASAPIWHESLNEYFGLMLIDFHHSVHAIYPQPFLITFADRRTHYPDFLVVQRDHRRLLVDVHAEDDEEQAATFNNTRAICTRLGWRYELLTELDNTSQQNLEWIAGYRHPRYRPSSELRERILTAVEHRPTFGALRAALRTDRPGEHLPMVYHLMWCREIRFDLATPFTDRTRLSRGTAK